MEAALRPESWVDRAACRDEPTVLFFGPAGERPEQRAPREVLAKAVCAGCPVRVECREYARSARAIGVYGGETEVDRALAGFAPAKIESRVQRAVAAFPPSMTFS